jgi:Fic family protein
MSRIAPVEIGNNSRKAFFVNNEEELVWWYMLFETIHPFQDGNGRVGGIVVAIMSYSLYRKYLIPIS